MSHESENIFTFTWRIENYSFCNQACEESLDSPKFTAKNVGINRGLLAVYPRGQAYPPESSEYVELCLFKGDSREFWEINDMDCIIELISPNGKILSSKELETDTKYGCGYRSLKKVMKISSLMNEMKNWAEDTLTIRCSFIAKQQTRQREIECEATTKIGSDRCSIPWRMSNPSTSEWCERRFLFFSERTPYVVTLTAPEDDVMINIKKKQKNYPFVTCRMSLVDVRGKVQYSQCANHSFKPEVTDTWNFPTFFTKTTLKDNKDTLLEEDDTFTLICEFSVANGKHSYEIKYRTLSQVNASRRPDPISYVLSDLRDMFTSKKHADVKLSVEEEIFPAHKSLLSCRSPVFSAMFDQDMLESQTGVVEISDMDAKTMNSFLEFIYTGTVNHMNYENATKLLIAAEKYEVLSLKEECASFLMSVLSEENVCEVTVLADMVGHELLKISSLDYIRYHARNILHSPQWSEWIEKNINLASEIFCMLSTDIASGK